jgi:glycosyltransferase involved in cell wall biosynthesis
VLASFDRHATSDGANVSSTTEPGLVSVVIPCFNQARFLSEAVESVLSQSYARFELIVVDDGSTDGTREVATGYPAVRCISQRNQGLAAARNAGLRESRGEFVVFLDADDRLLPDALATGIRYISTNSSLAFVSGHCRFITVDGKASSYVQQPVVEHDHYRMFLTRCYIWCPANVLYRRRVFDATGAFNARFNPCEDYELYLRIARTYPVVSHGHLVAEYRHHENSMSRDAARMLIHTLKVVRSQKKYIRNVPDYRSAYRLGRYYWRVYYGEETARNIRNYMSRGEWRLAVRSLLILMAYHPAGAISMVAEKWPLVGIVLRRR